MTATTDRVSALVEPIAERLGLSVYDIDQPGGTLRVMLDAQGGVDLDALAEATREISRALDEDSPLAGSYTLEVSSPGLERPLRLPRHWQGAIGERVKVKLMPGVEGDRRCEGTLLAFSGDSATIDTDAGERIVATADVSGARTMFEWEDATGGSGSEAKKSGKKQSKDQKSKTQQSKKQKQKNQKSKGKMHSAGDEASDGLAPKTASATASPTTESSEERT